MMRSAALLAVFAMFGLGGAFAGPAPKPAQRQGWSPGGPLKPIFQAAVRAVHERRFDDADALCAKGLKLAPGDKAFLDLQGQIPKWRRDTRAAQVTALYGKALRAVQAGNLDEGDRLCAQGLTLDPGNRSFAALQTDIAGRRHTKLENFLRASYDEAAELLAQGHPAAAERRCKQGLAAAPGDPALRSLLRRIRAHE